MRDRSEYTTIIAAIIVALCLTVTFAVVDTAPDREPHTITTNTATGEHGEMILETSHDNFLTNGYRDGDQILIEFPGKAPIYGLFCENRDSVGYFEVAVSLDPNTGMMTLGQKFGGLDSSYTGTVNISFVKHLDRVERLGHYLDGKIDYSQSRSDDTFCNHREVTVGDIKSGLLYRSTDPFGMNEDGRAYYADYYAGLEKIAHEIDLCESASSIEERMSDGTLVSTYCLELYKSGNVFFKEMSPSLFNNTEQFKACFEYMIDNDGPFLIHCMEGKDRTGLFFILLEGICGASMDEIVGDYMQTMVNFYNIEPGSVEYNTVKTIMFDRIVYFIANPEEFGECNAMNWEDVIVPNVDINKACNDYLLNQVGMTQSQIDALVAKLTN